MLEVQLVSLSMVDQFMEDNFEVENFRENLRFKQEIMEQLSKENEEFKQQISMFEFVDFKELFEESYGKF